MKNLSSAGRNLRNYGSRKAAQSLGSEGGKSKSKEKVAAARKNGRKHTGD